MKLVTCIEGSQRHIVGRTISTGVLHNSLGEVRFGDDGEPTGKIFVTPRGHAFFSIGGYELSTDDLSEIIDEMTRRENQFKQQRTGT